MTLSIATPPPSNSIRYRPQLHPPAPRVDRIARLPEFGEAVIRA
jgi:hypothetical protein